MLFPILVLWALSHVGVCLRGAVSVIGRVPPFRGASARTEEFGYSPWVALPSACMAGNGGNASRLYSSWAISRGRQWGTPRARCEPHVWSAVSSAHLLPTPVVSLAGDQLLPPGVEEAGLPVAVPVGAPLLAARLARTRRVRSAATSPLQCIYN